MFDKKKIHDAFKLITDVDGCWEDQAGAIALPEPSFSMRLLYPGRPWEFRHDVRDNFDAVIRLGSTMQLKLHGIDSDQVLAKILAYVPFKRAMREAGVVVHDIISTIDASSVFTEWENTYIIDLRITWVVDTPILPEDEQDTIEYVTITGTIGDTVVPERQIPATHLEFTAPEGSVTSPLNVICTGSVYDLYLLEEEDVETLIAEDNAPGSSVEVTLDPGSYVLRARYAPGKYIDLAVEVLS